MYRGQRIVLAISITLVNAAAESHPWTDGADWNDKETYHLELLAARQVFANLDAAPDLARVDALLKNRTPENNTPLSTREAEVLKCIASGATNREIATTLGISEKTVARHVSNIFVKLDLPSRAAATAYAFRKSLA